jgi:hypothetical protein
MIDWTRITADQVLTAFVRHEAMREAPPSLAGLPEPVQSSPKPGGGDWEQLLRLVIGVSPLALDVWRCRVLGWGRPHVVRRWAPPPGMDSWEAHYREPELTRREPVCVEETVASPPSWRRVASRLAAKHAGVTETIAQAEAQAALAVVEANLWRVREGGSRE